MTATLLLHWELDAVADGTLTDVSGAGRGGVVEGTATANPDARFGSCLTPATWSVLRTAADDPALRTPVCTVAVWADLQRPPAGRTAVVGGRTGGATLAVTSAGAVVGLLPDGRVTGPDGAVDFAGWHHLALTDDGTVVRILVDGVEQAHGTRSARSAPGPGRVVLGAHAGGAGGNLVLDLTTTAKPGWTTTALATAGATATAGQGWTLAADTSLQNRADPTLVLDVMGGTYASGTAVIAYRRNVPVSDNQSWTHLPSGQLQSLGNASYVLDANGGGTTPGDRAVLWKRNSPDSPNQVWAPDADGRLRNGLVAATGRFAHLRVYDGALEADALLRDMADDQSALAAFVRSHPLAAELTNAAGQPVLYIDDGLPTQRLTLRLTNTSRQDVELRALPGAVSADCRHVAVRLRPGTLAAGLHPSVAAAGWTLVADPAGTALYLGVDAPLTVRRGAWVDLPLDGLNADGTAGTHGTRVEVAFAHVGYAGETQEISGSRLVFLDVVNHRGRPDIPLHAAFVGGGRVLSDGSSANTLRIRLSTVSRDIGLALAGVGSAQDAASAFVVSFESQERGETREWALTDSGNAEAVTLSVAGPGPTSWQRTEDHESQRRSWTLTPDTDTTLDPGTAVELTLGSIHALPAPGQAGVVIAYRNVPGYQDGFLALAVERSPLLFGPTAIGLGTAAGDSPLTVVAENAHVLLRRETARGGARTRVFLDMVQGGLPDGAQTYPNVRLRQEPGAGTPGFGARLEAQPDGLHVLDQTTDTARNANLIAGTALLDHLRIGGVPAGDTSGACAHVVAESEHLQLRRPAGPPVTGSKIYLELVQERQSKGDVYPAIRFSQVNRFSHRIEGRPDGISFRDGDTTSDKLVDVFAATVAADRLRVGGTPTGNELTGLTTVRADNSHLQLRRESTVAGRGAQMFLELFQDATPEGSAVYPCIRFHQKNKFWYRVEAGPDGFAFRQGGLDGTEPVAVTAGTATLSGLRIGDTTIGEPELKILQALAAGQLTVALRNTSTKQYAFASGGNTYDKDRRYVFTWNHEGERYHNDEWQLERPS